MNSRQVRPLSLPSPPGLTMVFQENSEHGRTVNDFEKLKLTIQLKSTILKIGIGRLFI